MVSLNQFLSLFNQLGLCSDHFPSQLIAGIISEDPTVWLDDPLSTFSKIICVWQTQRIALRNQTCKRTFTKTFL